MEPESITDIPLRELRNDISSIMRRVRDERCGFRVTVNGVPAAEIRPVSQRRQFVSLQELRAVLAQAPYDETWEGDLKAMRAADRAAAQLEPDPWGDER